MAQSEPSFALAFVHHYTKFACPETIVRDTEHGITITRHNGHLGAAYREIGEPLVIRRVYLQGSPDKAFWVRFTAFRIDCWLSGRPDPDSADEWYAAELERLKDRAPA